jgi:hypothetical protein
MGRQDRVFAAFAKQAGEQDFPKSRLSMPLRVRLKHETPAFQA